MRASTQYDNIHGSGVSSAISFSCLHGGGPPTNATATPILRNITVQNMALTGVVGDGYGVTGRTTCAYIQTLQESPIDGLFLKNVSIAGSCNAAFACNSFSRTDVGARGERKNYELYANGSATDVNINGASGIGSPVHCHFLNQPPAPTPTPPSPARVCAVTRNVGCFNDTTADQQQALLPTYIASLHDHVTLEGCAAACDANGGAGASVVAGIRDGNHCYCGPKAALSAPTAQALDRPLAECLVPSAACPCGGSRTHGCSCRCSGNFSQRCGAVDRLLAFSFACTPAGVV